MDARQAITHKAHELGFDAVRFTRAALPARVRDHLNRFVAEGRHADMGWMADTAERRGDPQSLWPQAVTAVSLGVNYGPGHDPRVLQDHPGRGHISVYARNRDYHDWVKGRMKTLGQWMASRFGGDLKVFVDTAPVMEKPLAEQAGLGWQGKHTNLVSRDFGSWLFLGEILTTLEVEPDAAESDHCGSCTRCITACPTDAITAAGEIDARLCISYLTIENKGPIPRRLRPMMGNRIYGCDDCLAVCPWNRFSLPTRHDAFKPRAELAAPRLGDLAELDDAAFRTLFSASPIKRIGRDRFMRNVFIAIGNSQDEKLIPRVRKAATDDPSPLVRGTAVWALSRLEGPEGYISIYTDHRDRENDPIVQEEWDAGYPSAQAPEPPGHGILTTAHHSQETEGRG
ncbi:Epoxyqueuosine (oQ) reductase QueG [Caenispirillum salinarum AK4]|uniref:Epoxyqueuosine reductase n=1 Tax=Caenispirillum salinarum AK4 TaxID=1238182 RepID=K9HPL5_9PROT|nr:tRNA epoxyqueuosine(34) reductase QueG [Caenispirillum salinarum]EKV30441.1 Epoxyqueuosine (oQ) reductase QueG [Caenispirillum salinarum AK4]